MTPIDVCRLRANIWKLRLLTLLRNALFILPAFVPLLTDIGLSFTQILSSQAIFAAAMVVFELPSGYFADRLGRARSLLLGSILSFLAFGSYLFVESFAEVVLLEIALAAALALKSGADDALLYDSLLALGREKEYTRIAGWQNGAFNAAEVMGALAGGLLLGISLYAPFWVQLLPLAGAILLAASLVEAPQTKESGPHLAALQKIWRIAFTASPAVRWLMIYGGLVSGCTLAAFWLSQQTLQFAQIPLVWLGAATAGLRLVAMLASFAAGWLEQRLGAQLSLLGQFVLAPLGLLLAGLVPAGFAIFCFALPQFVFGFGYPVLRHAIQRVAPSSLRASILSVQSLLFRLVFAVAGPVIGLASDSFGLPTALVLAGVGFLAASGFAAWRLHQHGVDAA